VGGLGVFGLAEVCHVGGPSYILSGDVYFNDGQGLDNDYKYIASYRPRALHIYRHSCHRFSIACLIASLK
jgi:hypothetical protein